MESERGHRPVSLISHKFSEGVDMSGGLCSLRIDRLAYSRFLLVILSVVILSSAAMASPTNRQAGRIRLLNRKLTVAQKSLQTANDIEKVAKEVDLLQSEYNLLLKEAVGDERFLELLRPAHKQLGEMHVVFALEGIKCRALFSPKMSAEGGPGGVSFTKDVAPLFIVKCGRCHVTNQRGMFSMATFAGLMKGSEGGKVLFPGEEGGPLIESIESGDMPRGSGKVSDEELAKLKKWILEGAKFDGPSPNAELSTFVKVDPADIPPERLELMRATGKETVSFANEIAPIFADRCAGCHGNGQRAGGGFDLATFTRMLRGGDSGLAFLPTVPEESLLIRRITAKDRTRMPRNGQPLTTEQIEKITTWIKEGATFDGEEPGQNVVMVAAIAKAQRSTHEELSAERKTLAADNWKRAMPGINADKVTTKNFHIVGNVGLANLDDVAKQAESLAQSVSKMLNVPGSKPMVKGRTTLFILNSRYDYSEFGKMIEQRSELPRVWRGHWNYNIIDSYGAFVPANDEEYSNDILIAQQIAGSYLASLAGRPPRWFSEGGARAIASQVQREEDSRVKQWKDAIGPALATSQKANDFMSGKIDTGLAEGASYGFMLYLMKADSKRFTTLVRALGSGVTFDSAFAKVYGYTPAQVADAWAANLGRGK